MSWIQPNGPIEAVLWDVDGTLVDSEPLHHAALAATCARFGIAVPESAHQAMLGMTQEACWVWCRDNLGFAATFEEFHQSNDRNYFAALDRLTLREAAVGETIALLHRMGVPQAAVTNAQRRIVEANLAAMALDKFIPVVVSADDVETGKPDPEGYLKAARLLGVEPSRSLVIEDSLTGAAAARAAGATVILWTHDAVPGSTDGVPAGFPLCLPDLVRASLEFA